VLEQCAEIAQTALGGLGYLKDDCSITDHYNSGFEIVTHPMTHKYARESFPWSMLDELAELGADAEHNGIHVHVSRAGFSDSDHIYRWLRLLMSNREPCLKIARRESTQWARFNEFNSDHLMSWAWRPPSFSDRHHHRPGQRACRDRGSMPADRQTASVTTRRRSA